MAVCALAWLPALAVLVIGVAFQWEGMQPAMPGSASVSFEPNEKPADRAGHPITGRHIDHLHALPGPDTTRTAVVVAAREAGEADDRLPVHLPGVPGSMEGDDWLVAAAALAELDARDHPGVTVTMESIVVAAATGRVRALGGSLSEAEMDALLEVTGWPVEWREEAKAIAWCESRYRPGAVGDGGNSLGVWQLWTGWFPAAGYSVEQAYDPVVNARVALYVRQMRGRWGGGGGWTCADLLGIP